jgi:hypothetical protein
MSRGNLYKNNMAPISVTKVAEAVLRRAQRQGYVVPRDVRTELRVAGLPETEWKAVLEQVGEALLHRQGRYYHKGAYTPRLEQERAQQQAIQKAIKALVKEHRARMSPDERRGQARVDFIQPVTVRTEDGKEHLLLSRDISSTGVRLLGIQQLLRQKVLVMLPGCNIWARILWTCAVADGMFENGGTFIEVEAKSEPGE